MARGEVCKASHKIVSRLYLYAFFHSPAAISRNFIDRALKFWLQIMEKNDNLKFIFCKILKSLKLNHPLFCMCICIFLFLIIPAVALMLELVVRVHFFRPWLELYRGFLDAAKNIYLSLSIFLPVSVQFLEIKASFFALFLILFFCQHTNQSFRFTKPSFL